MQLEYYSNLLSYISKDSDMKNMIFPSVVGITDQGLNSMIVRLSELNSKKEALSYSLHDKNPSVQIIERELEYIKKSLEENLNNLVFNTQKELESINNDIEQVNKQLSAYPKTEQDLINIKRMVDLNNELYNFLLQKRAEAQITKASNVPDVDILDPAREVTVTQTGPRKKINLLIGLFTGLFLPVCFILVKDFLNTSIQDQEQIERISSIPVLASIIHNNYKEALPVNEYPRSILTESFRELRTSLDYLNFESKKKVIGVHSMIPGEGKTFVSSNLAAILAMNQKKVIVVGADMRKPTLHNYFGASATPGLSTYLIGAHKLEDIIKQSQFNNLHFIPAGEIPPNPVELLNSERFSSLIDELKERYDIIIIDNSPMSLVTDGAVTNKVTDTNLFVVRQNYSPAKLLSLLQTLASKHNMKKVGIVINDVNPKRSSQYAYTYGGYYSNKSGYFSEK
ncbi:polysaccharide biosynthesis tyrosine autokinase [Mangrovibacterium marinum]|uniref:tyrosine-protein kinase family protein n=1 Tax=Mangrovibacterium marinum TaxID=1639118 RepID=UPI002A18BE2F|nr:polysaccharide biosynthesis tyrosine autokinase [Mangrovibacterium marinum]